MNACLGMRLSRSDGNPSYVSTEKTHNDRKLLLKMIGSVGHFNAISVFYSFVSNEHLGLLKAMYIYVSKNIYSSSWKNVQFELVIVLKSESS